MLQKTHVLGGGTIPRPATRHQPRSGNQGRPAGAGAAVYVHRRRVGRLGLDNRQRRGNLFRRRRGEVKHRHVTKAQPGALDQGMLVLEVIFGPRAPSDLYPRCAITVARISWADSLAGPSSSVRSIHSMLSGICPIRYKHTAILNVVVGSTPTSWSER